jgi:hypothetical protein
MEFTLYRFLLHQVKDFHDPESAPAQEICFYFENVWLNGS